MAVHRLADHNVVGVFPAFPDASAALDALVEAGFQLEGELSLLGPDHEMRPAVARVVDANGEGATGTGEGLVKGGSVGGAIGATATTLGAVAATAIPGVGLAVGSAALIGVISGAAGGSTVGALLGVESAGRRTTMWQQSLAPLTHRVSADHVTLVAVHVDDEERAREARQLLEGRTAEVHDLTADVSYSQEQREAHVGSPPPSGAARDAEGITAPPQDDHELPR